MSDDFGEITRFTAANFARLQMHRRDKSMPFCPFTRDEVEANLLKANKIGSKGANSQQPQKRSLMEQQKHENELRKKFQASLFLLQES